MYNDKPDTKAPSGAQNNNNTDSKKAGEKEPLILDRLRLAQKISRIGIWDFDVTSGEMFWDDEIRRISGVSSEVKPSMEDFFKLVHPDDLKFVKEAIQGTFEGKPYEIDLRIISPHGTERVVHAIGELIRDQNEKPLRLSGIIQDITERKKTETALSVSEAKLRSIVENSSDQIFMIDRTHKYLFVNKVLADILGKRPEDIIGKSIIEVYPKETADQFSSNTQNVFTTGKSSRVEETMVIDNQELCISSILNPVIDVEGNVIAVTGIVRDITESKKMEAVLRDSEEKYRAIAEQSALGILIAQGPIPHIVYATSTISKSKGYSVQELLSLSFQQTMGLVHPDDRELFFGRFKERLEGSSTSEQYIIRGVKKDKSIVWMELSSALITYGGQPAVQAMIMDITERRKAEKELHESQERFRVLFEGANDGILVSDIKTQKFVLANPQMSQMVGYSLEELLKMSVPDIHPKESLLIIADQFARMAQGEKLTAQAVPLLRSDKQKIECEVSPGILEIWKQKCLVGFFRDVTDRKKAEKKLEESRSALEKQLSEINLLQKDLEASNKLLGQSNADLENYTYVVSHDLKAPLRAIRSFSTFILEDYKDKLDDTGKDYFQRIIDASTRMDTLIENLLLLSRVGRKFMEVETVDLNQLLAEIVTDVEPTLKKNNGKVIFHNLPKVTIPRTWMKQIFMNLIDNGLKFNKSPTPTIEVTSEENDKELLFKVADNGIGIEEKYFDRLFGLFERLHTQEEYPGTGAGLAICKKIVQQFGGKIWIESQVGKGTTFFFTLAKNKNPPAGGN